MARFSLLGTTVVALMMVGLHRSDAALIYYTSGLPSTASAGSTLNFGNIQTPLNGSYTFGSNSGISFGISPDPNGLVSIDNNSIQWASDAGIPGSFFLVGGNIQKFSSGASIGHTTPVLWLNNPGFAENGYPAGHWNAGGHGYAGLRLDAGGGNYHYGWVELNYNAAADSVTVSRFAFESVVNAAAVTSAAAPEPAQVASSLLLLSGVAGYVFVKRRHKKLPLSKAA